MDDSNDYTTVSCEELPQSVQSVNSNDYTTVSSEELPRSVQSVNFLVTDGGSPKEKPKKQVKIDAKAQVKIKIPRKIKCDREDEHHNPEWVNHFKPLYGAPVISSFLVIDAQKIFRNRFEVPELDQLERSEGISLLAELLGMYDYETNLISYWTLDVLAQVIKKCQTIKMKENNIKMCLIWIHFVLLTIYKRHPSREKLFKQLCLMFVRAVIDLPYMSVLPHPYHIKEVLEKERTERIALRTPKKKVMKASNITINHEEHRGEEGEEGMLHGEYEVLEHDILEEELEYESHDDSSSEEKDTSEEEEESEHDDDIKNKLIEDLMEGESEETIFEEDLLRLPDEAYELEEDIQEGLEILAEELIEARKTNRRDFFLLIDIIYKIFANRFKYTVIKEAFARPPRPKIVGIGNKMRIPKKVRVKRIVPVPPKELKRQSDERSKKATKQKKSPPPSREKAELSLLKKLFLTQPKKKPKKHKKKKSKYIEPLEKAVTNRFFDEIADHKYKQIIYREYMKKMEGIKKRLNLKHTDYKQMKKDLKALIASFKKKKNPPVTQKMATLKSTPRTY